MREIEIVTKITNDFICDSHGVIVTEYCKRQATWEAFKDTVRYELSEDFISELIPLSLANEDKKAAKTEQKETNDLEKVMAMIVKGSDYWTTLLTKGIQQKLLSYQEQTSIKQIISMAATGSIPASKTGKLSTKTMATVKLGSYYSTINIVTTVNSQPQMESIIIIFCYQQGINE